jgi:MoxR-like ATPase
MRTRHLVDTSTRFDRNAELPPRQLIELAGIDPEAGGAIQLASVERETYFASAELEDAINLAIALGRPLLLQGDPGAGKTRLAYAIAYSLGLPLEEAYIKSTSQGQDLLYTFDAVRRLYDLQSDRNREARDDARPYVRFGPLGRAIVRATYGRRSVVLIDEIDKADIDFPNDLLRELDELAFEVAEVPGMKYAIADDRPDLRPIIIVTNNEEKTLPAAFLRRCIFHYLEFPSSSAELDRILDMHGVRQPGLRKRSIEALLTLRGMDLSKKPGLSELLDWVQYLQAMDVDEAEVAALPYSGALLKHAGDHVRVAAARESQ